MHRPRISAFPTTPDPEGYLEIQPGMDLRDYFAAAALPVILANALKHNKACEGSPLVEASVVAEDAYKVADAMMQEREE